MLGGISNGWCEIFGCFHHEGEVGVPKSDILHGGGVGEGLLAFDVGRGRCSSKLERIDGRVDGDEGSVVRHGDPVDAISTRPRRNWLSKLDPLPHK